MIKYPRKSRHCITQDNRSTKVVSMKESAGNYQDSPESQRSSSISQIPPNQRDPDESARFLGTCSILRTRRTPAHGFTSSSHRSPQLATARESQPGREPHRRESLRTSSGIDLAGVEPSPVIVVSSPVSSCGLSIYGHRPFSLAHGLLI